MDWVRPRAPPYGWAVLTATTAQPETAARTYEVKTYGCQMNVHDSACGGRFASQR